MTSRARAFPRRTCSPTRPIAPATSSACRGSSRSDADDPRAHGRLSTRGDDAERGDRRLPVADREARRQGRRLPHGDGGPRARGGTRRGRAISSGPPARAARRRADHAQGRLLHQGRPHDVCLEDPRELRSAVRRHRGGPAREGRRRDAGQDQHGRVRDGLVHRALGAQGDAQPVGPHARSRRLVRRPRGRRRRGPCGGRARHRHRRLDPPAGGVLRRGRAEADVRARLALRPRRLRLVARSPRTVRAGRHRHGAAARRHRRPRPDGRDLDRRARARLHRRPRAGRAWPAAGRAGRVLPQGDGCRGRGRGPRGHRRAEGARRHARARLAASDAARARDLLRDRARRGVLESRALRRRQVRPARARPRPDRHGEQDARGGLPRRGQAPDHARHLRALRRLLRRVLRPGAEGAHARAPRLRRRLRARGPDRRPHDAERGLQARREGRSDRHVPQRRVHDPRRHVGGAGRLGALRLHRLRPADRPAAHRPGPRRGHRAARRARLRARYRLAHAPPGAGVNSGSASRRTPEEPQATSVRGESKWDVVIGLEVHAQLTTRTKMFCGCPTTFGAPPNTQTCPVCQGMPGTLPMVNRRAIEYGVPTALAFDCRVNHACRFARKHYYYPDMPKNFQISQYEEPLAEEGWLEIDRPDGHARRIGIQRLHLEEDVGKLVHEGTLETAQASLVDFNRAGVPLMETVSKPEIRSPEEAAAYLRAFRAVLVYLGVCDGNMEEGSLRCDANVSLKPARVAELGTKVEIKNMNSFRNVQRALEYEVRRQADALDRGERIVQETRLWDADHGYTRSMRSKEFAHDYRYFPEPDLVPLRLDAAWIDGIRRALPELPRARRQRLVAAYGLPAYDAALLTQSRALAEYYEAAVRDFPQPKLVSNWVMSELLRELPGDDERAIEQATVTPSRLARLLRLIDDGTISRKIAKTVFETMVRTGEEAAAIVRREGLTQVADAGALAAMVASAIAGNPKAVEDYRKGKTAAAKAFVGQVMKASGGKANPAMVSKLVEAELEKLTKT